MEKRGLSSVVGFDMEISKFGLKSISIWNPLTEDKPLFIFRFLDKITLELIF